MPILDVGDVTIATGDTVTARHFNLSSEFSRQFCDFFQREHRLVEVEHGALNIPAAAGHAAYAAGAYSWTGGTRENFESTITRNGTGDVTLTLTPDMRAATDWFVDVVPRGVETGQPIFAVAYSASQTATQCRVLLYWNNGGVPTAIDNDFHVAAYGRRAVGATGEGSASVSASGDVRNRVSVDDVESAQHRNKIFTYYNSLRTAFMAQHLDDGRHAAPSVPIGAVLVNTPAYTGDIIWSSSEIAEARYDYSSRIDIRARDGWVIDGTRAITTQNTLTLAVNNTAIPLPCRLFTHDPSWVQIIFNDAPSTAARIGVVLYGRRAE